MRFYSGEVFQDCAHQSVLLDHGSVPSLANVNRRATHAFECITCDEELQQVAQLSTVT